MLLKPQVRLGFCSVPRRVAGLVCNFGHPSPAQRPRKPNLAASAVRPRPLAFRAFATKPMHIVTLSQQTCDCKTGLGVVEAGQSVSRAVAAVAAVEAEQNLPRSRVGQLTGMLDDANAKAADAQLRLDVITKEVGLLPSSWHSSGRLSCHRDPCIAEPSSSL